MYVVRSLQPRLGLLATGKCFGAEAKPEFSPSAWRFSFRHHIKTATSTIFIQHINPDPFFSFSREFQRSAKRGFYSGRTDHFGETQKLLQRATVTVIMGQSSLPTVQKLNIITGFYVLLILLMVLSCLVHIYLAYFLTK